MKLEKLLTWISNLMAVCGFVIIICAISMDDFYTSAYMYNSFTNTVLLIVIGLIMFVPKVLEMILDCWED